MEVVHPVAACRDPSDDKFLAVALAGDATMIVTGDKALLELHPFRGIPVLTARDALARIETHSATPLSR